jgi:hypothetical protein
MPSSGYRLRPRHLCSMALMSLAAFAALSQRPPAAAGTGPVSADALARSQAPAIRTAVYQPPAVQRLRAYESLRRPYALQRVRRHILPVVTGQPVREAPAPSPAASDPPAPAPTRQAPAEPPMTPPGSPREYALSLVGSAQFACLDPLWERESGWNAYAKNPGSGAYGIPQSLPGDKMASAGPDWQTDPDTQVRWGVSYIDSIYGSPCAAWQHEETDGWY